MPNRENEAFLLEILDEQDVFSVDTDKIKQVSEKILDDFRVKTGRLGVVLVDNDTIRQYNRDFLQHDYETDVISFTLESRLDEGHLEAEILACTELAKDRAPEFGWSQDKELLLYVVHGVLHAVGFDDTTPEARNEMRQKEREYLAAVNIDVPEWDFTEWE